MQVVILAGGKGTRMGEITSTIPKPLLSVGSKNLIEHKLDILPESINEVILVVSYLKESIQDFFGNSYHATHGIKRIVYVDQGEPKGTAHALWQARPLLQDVFLVMMGDDLYSASSVRAMLESPESWGISVFRSTGFKSTLDIVTNDTGMLIDAIAYEGSISKEISVNTGLYKFDQRLFSADFEKFGDGVESWLPHTAIAHALATNTPVHVHYTDWWCKINNSEDLAQAELFLRQNNI